MDSTTLHVGYEPQLFVDNWLIECTQGLTRRWYKPERHGDEPLVCRDRPWEQTPYLTYSNHCVVRDPEDGLVKCWYEDLGPLEGKHPWATRVLYADSEDGIHFRKPGLDICEVDGKATNIVMGYVEGQGPSKVNPWADVGVHSNGIIIDPFPPTPEERFRTLFAKMSPAGTWSIECAHSPDGIHWIPYSSRPTFGSSVPGLDDCAILHYDPDARQFLMNTRHYYMGHAQLPPETPAGAGWFLPNYPYRPDLMNKRRVWQTRSHDFLHWTDPVLISAPNDEIDNIDEAHYGMEQFRVGRVHFGTLGVFRYVDNEMEVRLLFSRDGVRFRPADRANAFFSPRGGAHWDAHMVSMTDVPIEVDDEMWFYHGGTCAHHDWWLAGTEGIDEPEARDPEQHVKFGLGLARLRKEGFASLDGAKQRDGYVLTRPLESAGERLSINARCRKGGSIRVAVLDLDNKPMGDCSLEASDVFSGDSVKQIMTWRGQPAVPAETAGYWRKLHFLARDAEIFSFRFVDAEETSD